MELRVGDIVINPAMPQWGKGEILSIFEGKAIGERPEVRQMTLVRRFEPIITEK